MPSNTFNFDTRDLQFIFKEWLDMDKIFAYDTYKDCYTKEDIDSFINVAYKIARDVLAPANKDADEIGIKFIDGKVITPDVFKTAYQTVLSAELGPQIANHDAEGHIPYVWIQPIMEMFFGASAGIVSCWCLTEGAVGIIGKYAAPELKEKFLPKMFEGKWGGTMNLTEAGAGSDVGALLTKAYLTDQPGVYKIKGNKVFISAGDHDLCENFVHLVLARIDGAREGTAGLSLFIVPKYCVNDDESLGEWNDVTTVGIEHKMGLKGSPTVSLAYGENDNCYGYLIGDLPDDGKGKGMAQMFNMMNEARMGTGLMALAVTSQAYYNAVQYTKLRCQGQKMTDPKGGRVRIIEHEDVRRMLLMQKSYIEAIRALIVKTYYYIDISHESPDEAEREYADLMVQISTPLVKAYSSDMAWPLIGEAIQTYGGYGYIEEYPVAQLARDSKIFSIWEGTNYIQSMDLVGRKFTMKKGKALMALLGDIDSFIKAQQGVDAFTKEINVLQDALIDFQAILGQLQQYFGEHKISMMPLYSTRILHATSMLYCSRLILDQGIIAYKKIQEVGEEHHDTAFYKGKIASARFYVLNILPQIGLIKKVFELGDTSAIDIPEEGLG